MDYTLVLKKDGTIKTPGVDFGPKGLVLVHRGEKTLIVKQPGHNIWMGVGCEWSYTPTVLVVFRILVAIANGDDGVRIKVEDFKEIPTGHRPKAALAEAMKLAAELESKTAE